ncbi:branched-chain amino acid ABC transporter permease [Candidatus Woesearchaeota archaeon]|nr:branched-chain amino acid ABC transporter permease [Candidatus Woesearchaeota archaeon]MBW3016651.1 branched-chain amino acid ABC transporter permease [Candidatus Woesearchaeota archaeon]
MAIATQLIINGIIAGAIYSLVASGFSLIYSVTKFMHFAHGAVLALGAYLLYTFAVLAGLNFWLAVLLTLFCSCLAGVFMDWLVYKPLRRRKASSAVLLIGSIALMILLNALILAVWGADVKTIPIINPVFDFLGARITFIQIVIIVVAVVLLLALWFLMKCTRLGKAMRAVADNKDVAMTVGINPERIYTYTFMIGSFLAGVAGILIGIEQNLYSQMGVSLVIKGFTGAVIGSLASVPGSVLGSMILGLVENIGIWWLPSGYKDAIAFVLLFIFLLFRPSGLLGVKVREA